MLLNMRPNKRETLGDLLKSSLKNVLFSGTSVLLGSWNKHERVFHRKFWIFGFTLIVFHQVHRQEVDDELGGGGAPQHLPAQLAQVRVGRLLLVVGRDEGVQLVHQALVAKVVRAQEVRHQVELGRLQAEADPTLVAHLVAAVVPGSPRRRLRVLQHLAGDAGGLGLEGGGAEVDGRRVH